MTEQTGARTFDARALFAAKHELATNLGASDVVLPEIEILTTTLAGQREAFIRHMDTYSPEIVAELRRDIPEGIQYALTLETNTDQLFDDEVAPASIAAEEFELAQRDPENQCLFVTPRAIEHAAKMIEGIVSREDMSKETYRRIRLEAASVMLAWIALGKWAFESIGSQQKTAMQANPHSLETMSRLAGIKLPEVKGITEHETEASETVFTDTVGLIFQGLSYASAGRLAYEGLMEHSKHWDGPLIDKTTLRLFQNFYKKNVHERLRHHVSRVSLLDVALSEALPPQQLPVLYRALLSL